MNFSGTFNGKVILVTGATSGIGEAAAQRFAAAGGKVGVLGRTPERIAQTVEAITQAGGEAIALEADVSDPTAMQAAFTALIAKWGRLDVVIANAGINGVWAPIEELTPEEWDTTLAINLRGTFLSIKYAVPHLKTRGGAIVVVASINGTRTFTSAGASAYSSSKAGQVALTKMAALELAKHRIRVNVVCPGAITTEIDDSTEKRNVEEAKVAAEYPDGDIPLTEGTPGEAEQVADTLLFLSSEGASHITGTEMWIDGGQSLLH